MYCIGGKKNVVCKSSSTIDQIGCSSTCANYAIMKSVVDKKYFDLMSRAGGM